MEAPEIGAMLKLYGILPTSFLGVKSFMETYWGFQMFTSNTETDDELTIQYWYKDIDKVLLLFLSDIKASDGPHA